MDGARFANAAGTVFNAESVKYTSAVNVLSAPASNLGPAKQLQLASLATTASVPANVTATLTGYTFNYGGGATSLTIKNNNPIGSTPLAVRTNTLLPISRSTDWMLRESADWLSPSAVAARAKLPCSSRAIT